MPAAIYVAVRARAGALFVMPDDPMMFNLRPRIVELAAKNRIPDFYWASQFVESGGLLSYGESLRNSYRAAAAYMDKIKKGANPGQSARRKANPFRAGDQHEDRAGAQVSPFRSRC